MRLGQDHNPATATTLHLPAGLWEHQRRAVETVYAYLGSSSRGGRAALVTMPTGTGKTGVIAAIVTLLPSLAGHRLVLTPWDALVRQLEEDLRGRFWSRLPATQRPALPPVRRLPTSSDFDDIRQTAEPTIFVTTIAAISVMASRAPELGYDISQLFSGFDCVVVDEGHYEPAYHWSQAIRALKRPTVLLTATPYRNDEKFFLVGEKWRFRFPHHEAEDQRFLRIPQFRKLQGPDPERFARQVVGFVDERFARRSDVRIIIRCKDSDGIRAIVGALERAGQRNVIGVHERFPLRDGALLREVPGVGFNARYWVHQNKLIEGIDDPRFKVLAFYDPLGNDRAIIQQIGRVLRNPSRDVRDMTAFVISRGDRELARTWDGYRRFDRQAAAESVATVSQLVKQLLDAQPEAFYYDGGYRTKIDLGAEGAWREFAFPLRTRVYRAVAAPLPTLDAIAEAIASEWRQIDRSVFRTQVPDNRTVIIPYVTAENSPLLRSGTFIEPEFGYTLIRRSSDLLFIYDARGRSPAIVLEHLRPLQPVELQSLFPNGSSTLTSVSLLNTDIGNQAARSRKISASAIDELAPDLADYAYVCSIAEGYTQIEDNRFRRYLGLTRSRITDYRPTERDYETYSAWLQDLEIQLAGHTKSASTFDRYAKYAGTPSDPSPVHVLLDINPEGFEQRRRERRVPLSLDETALAVVDGRFSLAANSQSHAASLSWNASMGRYDFDSPTLRSEQFTDVDGDRRELVSFINEEQALRVVPATRTALYSHGHFFEPTLPLRKTGAFQLLDVLYPVAQLAAATSEKGDALVGDDWQPTSVFGLISGLDPGGTHGAPEAMKELLDQPDMLLCTDLGTEVADFLATQGTRVVFMHAKASKEARLYSASALHDVVSQAIKNLPYLQPLAETKPRMNYWAQPWKLPQGNTTTGRLRVGNYATPTQMWSRVREVISNPSGEREVWLVLGQSLSKAALREQAQKSKPVPEAIQVFALLQTTWGAVSQLGARLRVFCSP